MSSILKALEKAEESSNPRRLAADSGVIRSNRRRPTWVMPAAVLCGAGVAALATYAAMGGFSGKKTSAPAPAVAKSAPVVVAPINPVVDPAPVPEQAAPAAAVPQAPAARPEAVALPETAAVPAQPVPAAPMKPARVVPVKPASPISADALAVRKVTPPALPGRVPVARPAAPQPAVVQAAPMVAAPVAAPAARPAPVAEAKPAAPARPQLKVSGIAYQDNGEASFAVVNGRAVLQGGMVDGYKVVEIRHDSVKFSGTGGSFEVPMEAEGK